MKGGVLLLDSVVRHVADCRRDDHDPGLGGGAATIRSEQRVGPMPAHEGVSPLSAPMKKHPGRQRQSQRLQVWFARLMLSIWGKSPGSAAKGSVSLKWNSILSGPWMAAALCYMTVATGNCSTLRAVAEESVKPLVFPIIVLGPLSVSQGSSCVADIFVMQGGVQGDGI